MRRFIGKKKPKVEGPTLDDVGTNMDARGNEMDAKIAKLDKEIIVLKKKMNQTRSKAAKRPLMNRAKQLLKQKKMYEKQREQLYGQQFNIDNTRYAIQSAKDSAVMYDAMQGAKDQLKKAYKEVDIDKIEDLHDEMNDLLEMGDEINEIMGQSYGIPDELDSDELLDGMV